MTNAKKYKKLSERQHEFKTFCDKRYPNCDGCRLYGDNQTGSCSLAWLELDPETCENTLADRIEAVAEKLSEADKKTLKDIAGEVRMLEDSTTEDFVEGEDE